MSWLTEKNNRENARQESSGLSCEFSENLDILRQIDIFAGLSMEGLKVFALLCSRESYRQGDYIFRQDENDGHAFYVFSGKAHLTYAENGVEEVVRDVDAGEMVGVMSIMGDVPRLYSLKAATDAECFVIARDRFQSALVQFPELMPKIIKTMVNKIYRRERIFLDSRNPSCDACRQNMGVIFA